MRIAGAQVAGATGDVALRNRDVRAGVAEGELILGCGAHGNAQSVLDCAVALEGVNYGVHALGTLGMALAGLMLLVDGVCQMAVANVIDQAIARILSSACETLLIWSGSLDLYPISGDRVPR